MTFFSRHTERTRRSSAFRGLRVFIAYVSVCVFVQSGLAGSPQAAEVAAKLDLHKAAIAEEVTAFLKKTNRQGSYTTVWRQYEDAVIGALVVILPKHVPELTQGSFDAGKAGREKNRPADFGIVCGTNQIEISIKSARKSANPENDMGTFNDHPARKRAFSDSFTVWVRYDDSMGEIKCDRAFFDRTWSFVGKSTLVDGVKYRKKDGNMRPKSWSMFNSGKSYWGSEDEFESAVKRSETFRANELVKEHLQDLGEQDQRVLYEKLRERFGQAETVEK